MARPIFRKQPPNFVLALDIAVNAHYNVQAAQTLKEIAAHNKPYVKAVVVCGLNPLLKIVVHSAELFSKRKFPVFDTAEQAKDWLAAQ